MWRKKYKKFFAAAVVATAEIGVQKQETCLKYLVFKLKIEEKNNLKIYLLILYCGMFLFS